MMSKYCISHQGDAYLSVLTLTTCLQRILKYLASETVQEKISAVTICCNFLEVAGVQLYNLLQFLVGCTIVTKRRHMQKRPGWG